jgi:lipopolysaccharide transport system permease protein
LGGSHAAVNCIGFYFRIWCGVSDRWGTEPTTKADFAIIFLLGMLIHGVFAEAIARGPTIILGNPSYVKRVVFPLEILPVSIVIQAVITGYYRAHDRDLYECLANPCVPTDHFFLPLLLAPYMMMVLGITLFFSWRIL